MLEAAERRRRHTLVIITASALGLIPWIVDLALTLPRQYEANHWRLAWVGFDVALLAFLAATAWLGWRRRQLVVLTAFTTAVLLCGDAWFDLTTAGRHDLLLPALSACVEIPLAILLFRASWRLLRITAAHYGAVTHQASTSIWTLPLPGALGSVEHQRDTAPGAPPP
jgi:hypothetical protein